MPPWPTGVLSTPADPKSPDEPRTVMPLAAAETKACRRFCSDCALPNACSVEAKLCEITLAR